jgi:pimeloyl-ACP methyl ester carboxylesterase
MHVSIRIKGHLDPSWHDYLEGLEIAQEADGTSRLSGVLQDQSALYGVLNMMSQLNLTLLSLESSGIAQKERTMKTVISKDGTPIAFDRSGEGAPIILVVGAFNDRSTGRPLAALLSEHFTVFNYDRRGRGMSGDTVPYAIEREIEDLEALITEAGGSASVFGYSSGAILALMAAARGLTITKLAMYDPPFMVDAESSRRFKDLVGQLAELIASDHRGEAVELFQTQAVGIPAEVVTQLRQAPFWPSLEDIAHTLVYEATLLGDMPALAELMASIPVSTLVISGGEIQVRMLQAAQAVADALPNAEYRSLSSQTHDIIPEALAPVLEEFFAS